MMNLFARRLLPLVGGPPKIYIYISIYTTHKNVHESLICVAVDSGSREDQ